MHSFKPILKHWLTQCFARDVWEWGPGASTSLILEALPSDGSLTSIEHDTVWAEKARASVQDKRWKLHVQAVQKRVSQYAVCILKAPQSFDLIFVDGRRRVECVFAALQKLKPHGVIVLHDASRKSYTDLISPYIQVLEYGHDTLVFRAR